MFQWCTKQNYKPPKLTWNSQKKMVALLRCSSQDVFFGFPSSFSRGCKYVVSQKLPAQRFTFKRNVANKKVQTMSNFRNLSHGKDKKHSYVSWNTGCLLGILIIFIMVYSPHSWVAFHPVYTLNNQGFVLCSFVLNVRIATLAHVGGIYPWRAPQRAKTFCRL